MWGVCARTHCMQESQFHRRPTRVFPPQHEHSSRDYTRGSMVSSASSARPRAQRADVVCVASCTKVSPTFLDGHLVCFVWKSKPEIKMLQSSQLALHGERVSFDVGGALTLSLRVGVHCLQLWHHLRLRRCIRHRHRLRRSIHHGSPCCGPRSLGHAPRRFPSLLGLMHACRPPWAAQPQTDLSSKMPSPRVPSPAASVDPASASPSS